MERLWWARQGCGWLGKDVEGWERLRLAWKGCGGLGEAVVGLERMWRTIGEAVES